MKEYFEARDKKLGIDQPSEIEFKRRAEAARRNFFENERPDLKAVDKKIAGVYGDAKAEKLIELDNEADPAVHALAKKQITFEGTSPSDPDFDAYVKNRASSINAGRASAQCMDKFDAKVKEMVKSGELPKHKVDDWYNTMPERTPGAVAPKGPTVSGPLEPGSAAGPVSPGTPPGPLTPDIPAGPVSPGTTPGPLTPDIPAGPVSPGTTPGPLSPEPLGSSVPDAGILPPESRVQPGSSPPETTPPRPPAEAQAPPPPRPGPTRISTPAPAEPAPEVPGAPAPAPEAAAEAPRLVADRPEGIRPEAAHPEAIREEAMRPEAPRPEGIRPEAVRADGIRPDAPALREELLRQREEYLENLRTRPVRGVARRTTDFSD